MTFCRAVAFVTSGRIESQAHRCVSGSSRPGAAGEKCTVSIQIRARIDLMPVQPWPECGKPDRENKYLDKGYRVYVPEYDVSGTVSRVSRLGGGE